ncbi:transposase (plasmid) [Sphingomonas paeninsulae]|uniref:Transposase n=1 Tax=Sphingomonas paeninsulae TaxID=2319844 RepID=A0A494T5N6_SPHPE|nr:transposase [Sphingomonas paeninsulae]
MWLTGQLALGFKTMAMFRRDNGAAIRAVCSQFVVLCRQLSLFGLAAIAIDGSNSKAVNNRIEQVEGSIERYLAALDRADREASDVPKARVNQIREKIAGLRGPDTVPEGNSRASRSCPRSSGIPDRSGCQIHEQQWSRRWNCRLQLAGSGGC